MELTSIKNMHIYMHLLLLILAARTLALSRYRREPNNASLPVNNSQNAANETIYLIETDWVIVPIFENASSEELSGSSSSSGEIGGKNGTNTNDTMVFVIVEEDYGSVSSSSSDNISNNGLNGETSNDTSISQNQPSNRTGS